MAAATGQGGQPGRSSGGQGIDCAHQVLQPLRSGTEWVGECEDARPCLSRRRHGPLRLSSDLVPQALFALNTPDRIEQITVGLLGNPNPLRS